MCGMITISIALSLMIATTLWLNVHATATDYCPARTTSTMAPRIVFSRTGAGGEKVAQRRTSAGTYRLAMAKCASSTMEA